MAKKIRSFADKARKGQQKGPNYTMAKYVKSVVSEKTGQYRFQETMLKIPEGMNIDSYLKQLEEEELAIDKVTEEDTANKEAEEAVAEARQKDGAQARQKNGTQTVEEEPASEEDAVAESIEESSEVENTEVETEAVETSPEEAGLGEDSDPLEKSKETTEVSEEESPPVEDVSNEQGEESPEEESTETEEKDSTEA